MQIATSCGQFWSVCADDPADHAFLDGGQVLASRLQVVCKPLNLCKSSAQGDGTRPVQGAQVQEAGGREQAAARSCGGVFYVITYTV